MAVTNTKSPGELQERVDERGTVARAYAKTRVGGGDGPRDVKSGKGFVNVNKLGGDGEALEVSRLAVMTNLKDAGGGRMVGTPPFPNAAVKGTAIFHKPEDSEAVMAVAPVKPGTGGAPEFDTAAAKFYKAKWDDAKKGFVQGDEIKFTDAERVAPGFAASAAGQSLQIFTDANTAKLTPGIVGPNFNKGGTFEVGALDNKGQQPAAVRRPAPPTMNS